MKKIVSLFIIALIAVAGLASALIVYDEVPKIANKSAGSGANEEGYPNLQIKNLTVSKNIWEVTQNYLSAPAPPLINITVYSKGVSQFQLVVKSPKNANITLFTENVIGVQNITFPEAPLQYAGYSQIFSVPGTYRIIAELFHNNTIISKSINLIVHPELKLNGFYTTPKIPVIGYPFNIIVNVTGGVPPYSIKGQFRGQYNHKMINFSGNNPRIVLNSTNWALILNVTDFLGFATGHLYDEFEVSSVPYTILMNRTDTDANVTDSFNVSPATNLTANNVSWFVSRDNAKGPRTFIGKGTEMRHLFENPGNYTIIAFINSKEYGNISITTNVTVSPELRLLNASEESSEVYARELEFYDFNLSGGVPFFNGIVDYYQAYFYMNNELQFKTQLINMSGIIFNGKNFGGQIIVKFSNNSTGLWNVSIKIKDHGGDVVWWNTTLIIVPDLAATISLTPANPTVNSTLNLTANITGGAGPFNITWTILLPNGTSMILYNQSVSIFLSASGSLYVQLMVIDKLNEIVVKELTIQISS